MLDNIKNDIVDFVNSDKTEYKISSFNFDLILDSLSFLYMNELRLYNKFNNLKIKDIEFCTINKEDASVILEALER